MNSTKAASPFSKALALAEAAHHGQSRKGTNLPYILHPLAVASLVIEYGGDQEQAIAGLLHDAVEDGGQRYAGIIRDEFGARVLSLVEACTDGTRERKEQASEPAARKKDWEARKLGYINRLSQESPDALLVTACDKLHNVRSIIADVQAHGVGVFDRFTTGRDGTLWYYGAVCKVLLERRVPPAATLADEVSRLRELAGSPDEPLALAEALASQLDTEGKSQLTALLDGLDARIQRALAIAARSLNELSACQQTLIGLRLQSASHSR